MRQKNAATTPADWIDPRNRNRRTSAQLNRCSPAGRGDYSRPQFRLIYCVTFRNAGAKSLYPVDDVYSIRDVEHFLGVGAEWWFNSSSYGN